MAVMARESWTDERLDDLNHRVDEGFSRMDREFTAIRLEVRTEFVAVRSEMKVEFAAMRSDMKTEFASVRSEMKTEFASVRTETAAMDRTLIQVTLGGFAVMLVGFAGTIATILSQT